MRKSHIFSLLFILLFIFSLNSQNIIEFGEKIPKWAAQPLLNTENVNFIVSVNVGREPTVSAKKLACVLLGRLQSSYVIKNEAYLLEVKGDRKKEINRTFDVAVSENALNLKDNVFEKLFLINHHTQDNICYSLFSYPDSTNEVKYLKINLPSVKNEQILKEDNYVFTRSRQVGISAQNSLKMAFERALELLVNYVTSEVSYSLEWREQLRTNETLISSGKKFIIKESKAKLRNLQLIRMEIRHKMKENLHYYQADIVLAKRLR